MLRYCLDRYKTQEMCDKSVNSYLPALKFVLDWFVASKMVEKIVNAVFSNYCIFVDDINSYMVMMLIIKMIILAILIQKLLIMLDLWLDII